ncbi:MAG: hydantoinase/oxoprolinase family protein, partial [Candidatus Hodarchaeota archaeon]
MTRPKYYKVGVDSGGTFTDIFVFNEETGDIAVQKVPSTPEDPSQAFMDAVETAGVSIPEVKLFCHGTTVGTNALLTRDIPLTGMVTTKGFRDVHEIRRATRQDIWDHYNDDALPYIPRRHRLEVEERTDSTGQILTQLNEEEARHVTVIFKNRGMQAVAVCFINSYANGENEQRMKEILQEELTDAYICTSSELVPEIFEHERFCTCVINAILGPVVEKYIKKLVRRLEQLGYEGDVSVLHSGGGVISAEIVPQYACRVASSGVAAGAVAMKHTAQLCGFQNAIGIDMGGTSCDISLSFNGELRVKNKFEVQHGYPIMYPSIEVITIGAGGGSIAWVDQGGSLRNGPYSAGADPGPACYQMGGEEPTNTDANLILGYLDTVLLAGRMKLSKEAAEKAIQKIAAKFDMSVVEAAYSIFKVANANMCDAIRLISVSRGYDPREFVLIAFGGAGPLHAAFLAREIGIPTVIVPLYPGIHAATGCLLVDIQHDFYRTYHAI